MALIISKVAGSAHVGVASAWQALMDAVRLYRTVR
jgi:hypothetical protein